MNGKDDIVPTIAAPLAVDEKASILQGKHVTDKNMVLMMKASAGQCGQQ
jgi:hypothetical protein